MIPGSTIIQRDFSEVDSVVKAVRHSCTLVKKPAEPTEPNRKSSPPPIDHPESRPMTIEVSSLVSRGIQDVPLAGPPPFQLPISLTHHADLQSTPPKKTGHRLYIIVAAFITANCAALFVAYTLLERRIEARLEDARHKHSLIITKKEGVAKPREKDALNKAKLPRKADVVPVAREDDPPPVSETPPGLTVTE